MRTRIFKSLISFFLTTVFITGGFPLTAFAIDRNEMHTFAAENSETIEYYIDESGNPYRMQNNEKIYLMLPINSKVITEEELLSKLNATRTESFEASIMRAVPTVYYSLMQNSVSVPSNVYAQYITLENGGNNTAKLKKYTSHSIIRIRTADLGKPNIFSSKKVNISLFCYLEPMDQWIESKIENVDATLATGIAQNATSGVNYFYVTITQANNPVWFTLNVWTTPS